MRVVQPEGGRPIKIFASQLEDGALEQAVNLSRLPFVISHVALMPDAHQGYGMPIGGVLFADNAIVPYAIGVDIGCGVVLHETDLTIEDVEDRRDEIGGAILAHVPVGNGPPGEYERPQLWPDELAAWPDQIEPGWISKVQHQIGSLGGGNHFIELQSAEDGRVYLMLHSGSRSLGKKICDRFHKIALEQNRLWFSDLPDKELAYLPFGTDEAEYYLRCMKYAMRFAELNRARMIERIGGALINVFGRSVVTPHALVDCHHNYAAWENHAGRNGIVHRKGAVRARDGESVLIPGSMGTYSVWGIGRGNRDSFETCQHGAGRAMSRGAARRSITLDQMQTVLTSFGTAVYTPDVSEVLDEAPQAYKSIETVMEDSADLVEIRQLLKPLLTVKG